MKTKKKQHLSRKRILIVDDHELLRQGLAQVINSEPDLVVCGEAATAPQGFAAATNCRPDAAIVDISLDDGNGMELIKDLRAQFPKLPVLVLSMHDETLYAERALRAGARGYVMKREPTETMLAALRKALAGDYAVSRTIARQFIGKQVGGARKASSSPIGGLTDREVEVFELLGQGQSTRQIAKRLHLSMKTISAHRQNIKTKLKLDNASALVRHAVRWAATEHVE